MRGVVMLVSGACTSIPIPFALLAIAETPTAPPAPCTPVPLVDVPLTPKLKIPLPVLVCRSCPNSALAPFDDVDPRASVVAPNPFPRALVLLIPGPDSVLLSVRHAVVSPQDAAGPAISCARAACINDDPAASPTAPAIAATMAVALIFTFISGPSQTSIHAPRGNRGAPWQDYRRKLVPKVKGRIAHVNIDEADTR